MRKGLFIFSMTTLAITISLLCYLIFYLVYPFKTIEYQQNPAKVLTPVVVAGDNVKYEVNYCRYIKTHAKVSRQFIDGVIYTTPSFEQTLPTGCHKVVMAVKVPTTLNPDKYHLKILVSFEINKLRTIEKSFETESFEVISP